MGQLEDMAMFIRIVEAGGIGKAAEQLNTVKSAVSRRLNELEKRLGTRLIQRTTRHYSLTESGQRYYFRAQQLLDEIEELNEETRYEQCSLHGTFKLSAPLSFGLLHLSPLINEFSTMHPNLSLHLDFSDHRVAIIEEGYELAIRIGKLEDSSYQAKRLTPIRHILCASPKYLANHSHPSSPKDLSTHSLLFYNALNDSNIKLKSKDGELHQINMKSKISTNSGDFIKKMALHAQGIAYLPTFLVDQEITSGQLTPLLTQYQLPLVYAYAIFPKNRFLSRRCRQFIEFISLRLNEPYWDQCLNLSK